MSGEDRGKRKGRGRGDEVHLGLRHAALRCAVGRYCPLGFNATWAYVAATAHPYPDLRRDRSALLRAYRFVVGGDEYLGESECAGRSL